MQNRFIGMLATVGEGVFVSSHVHRVDGDGRSTSDGTGAALRFAIRHPDRIEHLVISSGNLPGSSTATAPPGWAKTFCDGYDAAVRAAERIPGAVSAGLASGGHLALGRAGRVRSEVAAFVETPDRSRSGA